MPPVEGAPRGTGLSGACPCRDERTLHRGMLGRRGRTVGAAGVRTSRPGRAGAAEPERVQRVSGEVQLETRGGRDAVIVCHSIYVFFNFIR